MSRAVAFAHKSFYLVLSDLCYQYWLSIGAVGQIPSTLGRLESSADGVEMCRPRSGLQRSEGLWPRR